MLPPGLCKQVKSLLCRDGGFLTWAAKPSVRESPDPANIKSIQTSVTSAPVVPTLSHYESAPLEVPSVCESLRTFLDDCHLVPVATNGRDFIADSQQKKEHQACVL
jgi:hypothetical protein